MNSDSLADLIDTVDGPVMMEHVAEFAKWRKEAGVAEELESLAYIEARMNDYGFRTQLILHDAYISLPGKASVEISGESMRCITHSFSRAAPDGRTAELVDLGGGTPADFARHDVRGKIVLVDGIATPGVSRRASKAGAVGQIHVSVHEHLHEMCISPVWGSPTDETVGDLPATMVVSIPKSDGVALRAKLAREPRLAARIKNEVDTGWRKTPILVCDLAPLEAPGDQPFVFFTGHHDTWYYGVMDNGGANATMLEVSRVCAKNRKEWRRGLRVVFWSGHSQGRYSGSSWYAEQHWEELESRALVHVNVDSTGGKGNTIVADTTAAAELRKLAREAIWVHSGQEFTNERMDRAGDQSFWGIGVSAIFGNMSEQPASDAPSPWNSVFGGGTSTRLGHGTGWWWHTPDDLLDKIEEGILVRDSKIYLHTVWRLLTDLVLPLDWVDHADYLACELTSLQEAVEDRFDLSILLERCGQLRERAERLGQIAGNASETQAPIINDALIAVSRALVPLDYTECDRFEQDPAISTPPYPSLRPIRAMVGLEPGELHFLAVAATRARNRIAYGLREATCALDAAISALQS